MPSRLLLFWPPLPGAGRPLPANCTHQLLLCRLHCLSPPPSLQDPADLTATSEDEQSSEEEGPLEEPNPHQAIVLVGGGGAKK